MHEIRAELERGLEETETATAHIDTAGDLISSDTATLVKASEQVERGGQAMAAAETARAGSVSAVNESYQLVSDAAAVLNGLVQKCQEAGGGVSSLYAGCDNAADVLGSTALRSADTDQRLAEASRHMDAAVEAFQVMSGGSPLPEATSSTELIGQARQAVASETSPSVKEMYSTTTSLRQEAVRSRSEWDTAIREARSISIALPALLDRIDDLRDHVQANCDQDEDLQARLTAVQQQYDELLEARLSAGSLTAEARLSAADTTQAARNALTNLPL